MKMPKNSKFSSVRNLNIQGSSLKLRQQVNQEPGVNDLELRLGPANGKGRRRSNSVKQSAHHKSTTPPIDYFSEIDLELRLITNSSVPKEVLQNHIKLWNRPSMNDSTSPALKYLSLEQVNREHAECPDTTIDLELRLNPTGNSSDCKHEETVMD